MCAGRAKQQEQAAEEAGRHGSVLQGHKRWCVHVLGHRRYGRGPLIFSPVYARASIIAMSLASDPLLTKYTVWGGVVKTP